MLSKDGLTSAKTCLEGICNRFLYVLTSEGTPVYQAVSSEEIFYTEDGSNWFLPPKILYLDFKLRGVTSEETVMVVVMSVRISSLTISPLGGEQLVFRN